MAKKRASAGESTSIKDQALRGMIDAAVEAVIEIGHAAEDIKSSLEHVQRAQKKAGPLIEPAKRATQKAAKAVRGAVMKKKRAGGAQGK